MTNDIKNDNAQRGDEIAEFIGEVIGDLTGIPGGGSAGKYISRYGKRVFAYYIDKNKGRSLEVPQKSKNTQNNESHEFLVVGLGHCGCYVTATLAQIISDAVARNKETASKSNQSNILRFFSGGTDSPFLVFDPMLLVGDVDGAIFREIDGYLKKANVPESRIDHILKLSYKPLAEGGAGHVPIFADFLTRGLLLLPTNSDNNSMESWDKARNYLVDRFVRNPQATRLIFYVFSTGGGSGAGSAPEIMRAQRFAMAVSNEHDPQIYFTGIAVMPQRIRSFRRHQINTGRAIIRYLADLNIVLEDESHYDQSPSFKTSTLISFENDEITMMPWEGLALVSNDVMSVIDDKSIEQEEVEANANRYIAQQIFNLAAAQSPMAHFEEDNSVTITTKNYQSTRLDPQDLKTGLVGPYAICYSVATEEQLLTKSSAGIDKMLLRAISLPRYTNSIKLKDARPIEGISIAPQDKITYPNLTDKLYEKLEKGNEAELEESDFEDFHQIPLFTKCPRVVYVFTAPQEGKLPATLIARLSNLIEWLFPSLNEPRRAIIRGTTAHYSLSIYIETSVVLCPDVQSAITNYIKHCWKQRRTNANEFLEQYREYVTQKPPIDGEQICKWLGESELYGMNVPNFDGIREELNKKWFSYIKKLELPEKEQERLKMHRVENSYLTVEEVVSALRYINYAYNLGQPEDVPDWL